MLDVLKLNLINRNENSQYEDFMLKTSTYCYCLLGNKKFIYLIIFLKYVSIIFKER